MRKTLGGILAVLATLLGLAVATPAAADPPGDWPDCYSRVYGTTFAYSAGSYNVYAGPWEDYQVGQYKVSPPSICFDINVEVFDTGSFIVRTVICPKPPPAPQFACYALPWGTVTTSIDWGVTAHWYHFPDGDQFYFRVETKNSSEGIWLIY